MITISNNVIRCTESGDTKNLGGVINVKGVRLVAGSGADATGKVYNGDDNSKPLLMSLAAVQKTSDESQICFRLDSQAFYVELTGTGAELYIYLE